MKPNTIKYMRQVRQSWEGSAVDGPMIRAQQSVIESLARRVRKLERAAKAQEAAQAEALATFRRSITNAPIYPLDSVATPERKVKQEQYPRLQAGFNYMSEDVMITVINTPQFVGYYNYCDRQWMIYTAEDASVPFNRTVKSWQYLPDSQPQPANQWINVEERLPEPEENMDHASVNVIAINDKTSTVYAHAYCVYSDKSWHDFDTGKKIMVTRWQYWPELPND